MGSSCCGCKSYNDFSDDENEKSFKDKKTTKKTPAKQQQHSANSKFKYEAGSISDGAKSEKPFRYFTGTHDRRALILKSRRSFAEMSTGAGGLPKSYHDNPYTPAPTSASVSKNLNVAPTTNPLYNFESRRFEDQRTFGNELSSADLAAELRKSNYDHRHHSEKRKNQNSYQLQQQQQRQSRTRSIGNSRATEEASSKVDYVASRSHASNLPTELDFAEGDGFVLVETDRYLGSLLYVTSLRTGQSGYVSRDHVTVPTAAKTHVTPRADDGDADEKFYHGSISREKTEKLLCEEQRGAFLLRDSETVKDTFVLSVKLEDGNSLVRNYRINHEDGDGGRQWFVFPHERFESLDVLIKHYRKASPEPGGGLTLTKTIRRNDSDVSDAWEIRRDSLVLTEKLGDGSFGVVWKGVWREGGEVAVKMVKGGAAVEDLLAEAEVMKSLRHPNIIELYAVVSDAAPCYIVTEYMAGGNLAAHLREGAGRRADRATCLDIALQVASGMRYLEKRQLIHCDLRAANVLVDGGGGEGCRCKIADFGLARFFTSRDSFTITKREKFPLRWTAPEAIRHLQFTLKSDVWSFGILLHEIFTRGARPYENLTNQDLFEQLSLGYRLPCPSLPDLVCPPTLYDLMMRCWQMDHTRRPSFGYIQNVINSLLR